MAKEGRVQPHSPGVGSSMDVLAQADNALNRDVQALKDANRTNRRRALTVITPGSPFIITQVVVKKGIEVGCQIELPPASSIDFITAVYRETSLGVGKNREQTWDDIPQSAVNAAHFEGKFNKALEPSTEYGLVALIARGDFPTSRKTRNPEPPDDTTFLTTWTTIGFFQNDPSKPDVGLIVKNKFDEVTKAFDAFIVVRVYAPINGILTAYSGTATINGTTTVTGTVTFVGEVAVGQLISINSQTRQVTNVSGSTLTVDLPFIGSGSGLELLWGIPHTWETALVDAVISHFRLTDDPAEVFDQRYNINDDEMGLTYIQFRVTGFVAARKYDWARNTLIGESGRIHILPASIQTFIAGAFTQDTPGLPELTSPTWRYDTINPNDDGTRNVQFFITQPNRPIALDNIELQRRITCTGTLAYTSGVAAIVGTGTLFLSEVAPGTTIVVGAYLAAGYQRMVVTSVTDDTHLSVESTSLPTATASGQAFKAGRILEERGIRRRKFHPTSGGVIKFNIGEIKTKKLATQDFVVILTSQNGNLREDVDTVITGTSGDPVFPDVGDASAVRDSAGVAGQVDLGWTAKKGWNTTFQEPLTNWENPRGYALSFYYNNGVVTRWMNPYSGALLVTVTEATVTADERNTANTGGVKVYRIISEQHFRTALLSSDPDPIFIANGIKSRIRGRNFQVGGKTISANKADATAYVVPGADSTTPAPGALAFPGSVGTNTVDGETENAQARIGVTVATASGTFAANNTREIAIILFRRNAADTAYLGDPFTEVKTLTEAERAATSATHEFNKKMGQRFHIVAVKALNGDKATETTGVLGFVAGGLAIAAASIPELTSVSLTLNTAAPYNGKKGQILLNYTQPATPVSLRNVLLERSIDGGTVYDQIQQFTLRDNSMNTTGAHIVPLSEINTKKNASNIIRATITAQGGATRVVTLTQATPDSDDGAVVPTAIAFPSAPSGANNTVDGDPDGSLARIALTLATISGTFTANNTSQIEIVMIRRNSGNTADVGNPFSEIKVLATSDLAASSCVHEFYEKVGERFRITKVVARNGDKRAETTGTADFVAGGFILTGSCPAPSFQVQPAADGNKRANFTLRLTNTNPPILFKNMTVEVSYGGGTFRHIEGSPIGLKSLDDLNVASATKDFVFTIGRKPGVTLDVRATARMVGPTISTTTNATQLAASADDLGADTAQPTLATNPATGTTGPTVSERHSKIDCSAVKPSANVTTLDDYQFVLSTSSSAPAGTPSVGSEGVLVIKYGQDVTFNLNYAAAFNTQFYVGFRAHNQIGYSAWSAMTNQNGYSRPIQDLIGTAVPTPAEDLVRTASSGTGHTTTAFVLDSGASAVDDFYNGMALLLTVPGTSTPAEDHWRTITDYVGSTRTCTVAAYSSAPSGSMTYGVSRIGIPGDRAGKSQTTHTTTTFQLDSGASAVTDFYKGYTLFVPGLSAARRLRKVIAYDGSTKTVTVDVAWPAAPSGAQGFLLVNGSVGFTSAGNAGTVSGVAAPVSFRFYLDGSTDTVKYEVLPPADDNSFSLTHFQIIGRRESNEVIRLDSGAKAIVSGLGHEHFATAGFFAASSIRFRNLFRDAGSDGWSPYSLNVEVPQTVAGGGTPNYNPETFGVVVIDYEGESSYPDQRYPSYN